MEEIRLGTVGSGIIVHTFLDNVQLVDGIRLAAVYSRQESKGQSLASKYGGGKVYTDMDAFLADREINFVYIAAPNLLHYEQAKKALLSGKNVILEKPFCTKAEQVRELAALAKERGLFLVDAVPTAFLPNFTVLQRELPRIGKITGVQANYSQYSSRYDSLMKGELPNVFNPAFGGGCLMDINFYNVYLTVALFGKPQKVEYFPNFYKNLIDISGTLVMHYDSFTSEVAGAKDADGKNFFRIEGTKGEIYIEKGSNGLAQVRVITADTDEVFNEQEHSDRLFYEVREITNLVLADDYDRLRQQLSITPVVIETLEIARKKAGIVFPND